jgi:hypothetical protein
VVVLGRAEKAQRASNEAGEGGGLLCHAGNRRTTPSNARKITKKLKKIPADRTKENHKNHKKHKKAHTHIQPIDSESRTDHLYIDVV